MLVVSGQLAAALHTDIQQAALLQGVLSHPEERNPGQHRLITEITSGATWVLNIIHVVCFLSQKSCSYVPKAAGFPEASPLPQGLVSFCLEKSYCLCIGKYRGPLGDLKTLLILLYYCSIIGSSFRNLIYCCLY